MASKKIAIVVLSFFLCSSFLFPQSLAELAKKEKERRQALKKKKGIVVTNADLKNIKRNVAVSATLSSPVSEQLESQESQSRLSLPKEELILAPSREREKYYRDQKAALEQKWKKAKEYADLLAMKMNGLWQDYYNFNDVRTRDKIQMNISETYLKLQKARQDVVKAKEELDRFLVQARKEGALPGWLR